MFQIDKICVIGAGVMGAGIAAQIANSQTKVILLDIMAGAAMAAKEKMLAGKLPQIAHPSLLEYIRAGNLDEELELIKDCNWIIEVVVEKLEVKSALYSKILPYMQKGAVLSSNTSTLPMSLLRESLSSKDNFLLTHFFNPPRQMQLVELIYDDETSKDIVLTISKFITNNLGKSIVKSNDTPGFIANRIGCFLMELCLKEAYEKKLSIEYIDNYFSKKLGLPSTGIFGLFDLIGLDVMQMISEVLVKSLSKDDAFVQIYKRYDWYDKMLKEGYKGRKGLGGFYRMHEVEGKKIKEVLDFKTMTYTKCSNISSEDPASEDASIQEILDQFFEYTDGLLGVVSNSKEDIDTAIKLGYSWKYGPFEMKDHWIKPNSPSTDRKMKVALENIILENQSAYLRLYKQNILIFSCKTKMNTLDHEIFTLLIESVEYVEKHHAERLIIMNPGKHFSAGANLKLFLDMAEKSDTDAIEDFLVLGQEAMLKVKYSKVPVIACAKGVALGGGCELLLHCNKVVAHLDLSAGLVEVGIGLIPGWGGTKEMILRAKGDKNKLIRNLRNIITQNRSSSAYQFFDDYMIENGKIVMNEEQLLEAAINCTISASKNAPKDEYVGISKPKDEVDLMRACEDLKLDNNAIFILKSLQDLINSDSLSEARILAIERTIFKKLLSTSEACDKIRNII